jgi:hypothetical protein
MPWRLMSIASCSVAGSIRRMLASQCAARQTTVQRIVALGRMPLSLGRLAVHQDQAPSSRWDSVTNEGVPRSRAFVRGTLQGGT